MIEVKIETEFINLTQFLKLMNIISSGGEVSYFLEDNDVRLDDEVVFEKRKKIYKNMILKINDEVYKIV